jgi:hypothetical protein
MRVFQQPVRRHAMIRAKLWFRCAGAFNPVTPVIHRPAVIGWRAKQGVMDFAIERAFTGEELVLRMKGWVTADVRKVIEIVKHHGYLKVLDEHDLVVETESKGSFEHLERDLKEVFGNQIDLEKM